jgi:hypothetical protein
MANPRGAGSAAKSKDRHVSRIEKRKRILIVCEGIESEPNYFQAIIDFHRLNGRVIAGKQLDLDVLGTGRNTLSLVNFAEAQRGSGAERDDEVWCVFDKDDFEDDDFDNAIHKINAKKYHAAWSNEAFELWYVLHFEYHHVSTIRQGKVRPFYKQRLDKLLTKHCNKDKYKKNDPHMYLLLGNERLSVAIANAKRLLTLYDDSEPHHQRKPATTVHELVEMLLKYAQEATYPK